MLHIPLRSIFARGLALLGVTVLTVGIGIVATVKTGRDEVYLVFLLIAIIPGLLSLFCFVYSLFKDGLKYKIFSAVILLIPILYLSVPKVIYWANHQSNVAFQEVKFDYNCYFFNNLNIRNYQEGSDNPDWSYEQLQEAQAIASQAEYQRLLPYRFPTAECKSLPLPEVDFNQKMLLGFLGVNGNCTNKNFIKIVQLDSAAKELMYEVENTPSGFFDQCRSNVAAYSMNWIIVPKVPNDYNIKFVHNDGWYVLTYQYDAAKGWVQTAQSRRRD